MKRILLAAALAVFLPFAASAVTPGNVANLIKAMPHLSAGEFSLGMSRDQAIVTLKAGKLFDGRGAEPSIGFRFRQLPDQDFLAATYGVTSEGAPHYE